MAYAAWSVANLDVPNVTKWNILGTNDAFFNSQIGTNFSSGTTSKVWWEELGRTTLGVAGDTITINPIAARKYLKLLVFLGATGGNLSQRLRFNNDSGNNYAYQASYTGAAYASTVSTSFFTLSPTAAAQVYGCYAEVNISNSTNLFKMITTTITDNFGADATSSVNFAEVQGKWASTSQVTRIDVINAGTGDFAIGSEVIVLGHD